MNTLFNYLIESNTTLLLFMVVYFFFLKNETNFRLLRIIILIGIIVSVLFPLIHIKVDQERNFIPTLTNIISSYWLPEIVVGGAQQNTPNSQPLITPYSFWNYALIIYAIGFSISAFAFLFRLLTLLKIIYANKVQSENHLRIVALSDKNLTFSFFNFIFIGNSHQLSLSDKQQIIAHESVHVREKHSIDILLISLLQIVFWFNPLINIYKKIFVQLHEFEADARAVKNQDVDKYCSLLARVALQSAGLSLANHFNNSLTIKRIQMMRTIKTNIKSWKLVACFLMIPLFFFFIACQEQVAEESNTTAQKLPEEAHARFETFKQNHAGETFIVEYNETGDKILANLDNQYGKATRIENFTITVKDKVREFSMIQYALANEETKEVFIIVEKMPEFLGGFSALSNFISSKIRYPEDAKKAGVQGTVYVKFIVNTDGSIASADISKGVDMRLDNEALRVVRMLPSWTPAEQNGKSVRIQYTLPIKFSTNDQLSSVNTGALDIKPNEMILLWNMIEENGKRFAVGTVKNKSNNQGLKDSNILLEGTTTGVSTDADGNFKIPLPKDSHGKLVASFVGYENQAITF